MYAVSLHLIEVETVRLFPTVLGILRPVAFPIDPDKFCVMSVNITRQVVLHAWSNVIHPNSMPTVVDQCIPLSPASSVVAMVLAGPAAVGGASTGTGASAAHSGRATDSAANSDADADADAGGMVPASAKESAALLRLRTELLDVAQACGAEARRAGADYTSVTALDAWDEYAAMHKQGAVVYSAGLWLRDLQRVLDL